jgi:hypothetical protein
MSCYDIDECATYARSLPLSEFYLRKNSLAQPEKVDISQEQFEDIRCAVNTQVESLYMEQKYDFVMQNYLEFEESILQCGLSHMLLGGHDRKEFNADTALFNRRIMNLLTAYKTYDDTYSQHINRIFYRDKEILRQAKESFSKEYDTRVGYWLMPKIRNYVQHQGFPTHGSSYDSKWIEDNQEIQKNRYTVDLYISPKELSGGKFNLEVRERLSRMRQKVDLKFIIRDFMEGFSAAHTRNRDILADRLEWSYHYISSVIEEFLKATGYNSALSLASFGPDEKVSVAHFAREQRMYLVNKNVNLTRLTDRYVSNEVQSKEAATAQQLDANGQEQTPKLAKTSPRTAADLPPAN